MSDFALDPKIVSDSIFVAALPLSDVRLMLDANYPWLLVVPRRSGIELVDLDAADQRQLMEEITQASAALRATVPCDKLNVAALGNIVRQLHVHVIVRREGDAAWPKPMWAAVPAKPYTPGAAEALAAKLAARLK